MQLDQSQLPQLGFTWAPAVPETQPVKKKRPVISLNGLPPKQKEKARPVPVSEMNRQTLREAALAYLPKISDMPVAEQPINRLEYYGAYALGVTELLAIILGTPHGLQDAEHILYHVANDNAIRPSDGLPGLAQATLAELQRFPGIGLATAAKIKAALELGRRLLVASPIERPQVRQPGDAANLLMAEMSLLEQEQLRAVLLDTRNRVIAIPTIYIGSVNQIHVRIAELFREAIRLNTMAIILVHNHPSGDPTPSPDDVVMTHDAVQSGKTLGIDILDHLIIGNQRFVSMKERGLGF